MPGASRDTSPRETWPSSAPTSPRPLRAAKGPRGAGSGGREDDYGEPRPCRPSGRGLGQGQVLDFGDSTKSPHHGPVTPTFSTLPFWAVSQAESARNATQRRHFPRSEKLTANNSRQKPHRSPGPMAKSAPFSCETAQNPRGRDHGRSLGSRKRRCGRASDIAGSCPQARAQQPPAPTANGAPAATWTHPCSKSSHIGG